MTMSPHHVLLLTDSVRPTVQPDDEPLVRALTGADRDGPVRGDHPVRGGGDIVVAAVPWDAPDAVDRCADADLAVLRSTWNYTEKPAAFLAWLDAVEARGVRLCNDPATARWNADKIYLRDLEALGHRVLPTVWVARGTDVDLVELLDDAGWDRAIVKPRISATARGLFLTDSRRAAGDRARLHALLRAEDVMVQPFADEIAGIGEWSLVFVDGCFSHAVLKRAAAGEHRVQSDFGGTAHPAEPAEALLRDAQRLVDDCVARQGRPLLYARVDGIERDGGLVLMELEAIEPELFLRQVPAAARRLADAIRARLD